MTQSVQEIQPELEPPGAGLPRIELFVARLGFRLMTMFVSRAGASRWFRAEADRILALARSLPPADATRRVLIPRLAGLEDSSRYWSVCMTLEHLVIINSGISRTIASLAAGVVPPGTVSTADVKPGPTADGNMIDRFEAVACDYLASVSLLTDLRTKETHRHPWFGPLNALNWHRLAAFHQRLHRKQIESIIRLMPKESPAM